MPPLKDCRPGRIFLVMLFLGCASQEPDAPRPEAQSVRLDVPAELTIKQRTTTAVPGSSGKLLLTIDDVTRNQVMASLAIEGGELVMPTRSMSPEDTAGFKYGDAEYVLTLEELDNALVGDDTATFIISSLISGGLSEEEKIEKLIAAIAALPDAKFIRNATEHSAAEAAEHLRTKWDAARDKITTPEAFIEHVASKSSISGEPYQIKMADGTTFNAGDYLREKLAEIESGPPEK